MGAAIGHAQHRRGIGDHLVHHVEAAIGVVLERQHQQALAAARHQHFERHRLGRAAGALGDGGNRVLRVGLVVGPLAHREHLVERFGHEGARTAIGRRLDQAPPQLRIGREPGIALGGRELAHLQPRRMGGEGMGRGLQPHDDADRPRAHLRVGQRAPPGARRGSGRASRATAWAGHRPAPAGRRGPAGQRGGFQRLELARAEVGIDLQHAAAGALHAGGDAQKLGLAGAERGREAAVLGLVLGGARGGEAQGAGAQRLLGEARHLLDLALVRHLGMVGAALAHDVEAQRAVRQLGRHIDRAAHRVERVEIVGKDSQSNFTPSLSTVPGMSSTPSIRLIR